MCTLSSGRSNFQKTSFAIHQFRSSCYSCPLGRWVLKYSSVFFSFSVENLQAIIGCSGSRDVLLSRAKFNSEMQAMFCVIIPPSLCGFPCGSDFCLKGLLFAFKFTSPLRATYRASATYQLSTCRKWYVTSFKTFHHQFSHETFISITPVMSLARKASDKNPPGQNDHSMQKQTTRSKYYFVSIIILGHGHTASASVCTVTLDWLEVRRGDGGWGVRGWGVGGDSWRGMRKGWRWLQCDWCGLRGERDGGVAGKAKIRRSNPHNLASGSVQARWRPLGRAARSIFRSTIHYFL